MSAYRVDPNNHHCYLIVRIATNRVEATVIKRRLAYVVRNLLESEEKDRRRKWREWKRKNPPS